MPSYVYVCPECGGLQEEIHLITVDPVIECGCCGSEMERKPQVGGVSFVGSGWGKDV